jgi:uncharacterized protein (DUF2141 family)
MTSSVEHKRLLTLKITALRSQQGVVCLALFSSADGFPNDTAKAIKAEQFPIVEIPLTITLPDIPFGQYAATVFHDENADGNLNVGLFGIPQEGIGFSENPKVWAGPPQFQQADFTFTPESYVVEIEMKYF